MKLLFCPSCHDMFKLTHNHKTCECGNVTGNYINNIDAVTNGAGISVAIGNESFINASRSLQISGGEKDRDYYINSCNVVCWVRPNFGTGNPHTKVEEE